MSGAGAAAAQTRRGRRTRVVAFATAAVVAVGAGVAAAVGFGGGENGTASASSLPPETAKIIRQTLVDSKTVDGELGYGANRNVSARLGGTITKLTATGGTVSRGKPLYSVDEEKVVLLYGALPAYRTLEVGVTGADVKQFEQNLKALGYSGFTVDNEYTSATADAVWSWQESLGLEQTGRVEPGQIVYADGEVRVESHQAVVGDGIQPGQSVLTVTGTSRVVTVELDVADQRLAKKGAKVAATMPDGARVDGTISKVETVIKNSTGNGGQSDPTTKIDVIITVADPKALAGFDQASVKVVFTASERPDVLTVPVAALLALAEGGYGIELVEGATTRIVGVETGLFAAGRVEITGDGLVEGATVGMPK